MKDILFAIVFMLTAFMDKIGSYLAAFIHLATVIFIFARYGIIKAIVVLFLPVISEVYILINRTNQIFNLYTVIIILFVIYVIVLVSLKFICGSVIQKRYGLY